MQTLYHGSLMTQPLAAGPNVCHLACASHNMDPQGITAHWAASPQAAHMGSLSWRLLLRSHADDQIFPECTSLGLYGRNLCCSWSAFGSTFARNMCSALA